MTYKNENQQEIKFNSEFKKKNKAMNQKEFSHMIKKYGLNQNVKLMFEKSFDFEKVIQE